MKIPKKNKTKIIKLLFKKLLYFKYEKLNKMICLIK